MSDYAELFESLQQQSILSEADLSKLRGLSELSYASLPNYEQRKRDSVCLYYDAVSYMCSRCSMLAAIERARKPCAKSSQGQNSFRSKEDCES